MSGVLRSTGLRHLLIGIAGLAVVVLLSTVLDPYRNVQLANVACLLCAAAGLSVLTGLSGQISLGHGAFMAVGAYTAALLFNRGDGLSAPPIWVALLASVLVTAVVGVIVGAAAARLRGPYLAGATLAFAVGLPALASYRGFIDVLGGENGLVVLSPLPPASFGDVAVDRWQLWVSAAGAALVLVLLANLMRSRAGRSWRAVRDDEVAAELAGLNVARVQVGAFVVSAACAGLGGGLLAFVTGLAAPGAFGLALSLQLLAAVVIGGLGTLSGAAFGALLLVFLPAWSSDLAGQLDLPREVYANLPQLIYGLVLIAVMLLFPGGLFGGIRAGAHVLLRRVRPGGGSGGPDGSDGSGGSAGSAGSADQTRPERSATTTGTTGARRVREDGDDEDVTAAMGDSPGNGGGTDDRGLRQRLG